MSSLRRLAACGAILLAVAFVPASAALAQCVSLTTLGSPATQNFDTLLNTAGSTTNNLTIPGWFMTETGGGARDNEQYAVDTGASNTGDTYSYGLAASTERALGGLLAGTLIPVIGACFTNNTGATITSIGIAYTGEQWRIGNTAAPRDDRMDFQLSTTATSLTTGTWTDIDALDFTNPIKNAATAGALDGNAVVNRAAISTTIPSQTIENGATFWIRWNDLNASGADDGLAVDDFSVTPAGSPVAPSLSINDVTVAEGNAGTTTATFTVTLSAPAGAGGVTFDVATADGTATVADNDYVARSLTGQTIAQGASTYAFTVTINGDATVEPNEAYFVNVSNVVGATVTDGQGIGTISNDDAATSPVSAVQGSGAATPLSGQTVAIEGIVVGSYQAQSSGQLRGFFVQEEDADADADPATSEGIFVFCLTCPVAVAEGQRVRVTGTASEFFNMTQITASTAQSVQVLDAGNNIALATPATITLPIAGDAAAINAFYEAREGMRVRFTNTLSVSDYSELARFGQLVLYAGGRPFQFTEDASPSVAGYAAHLAGLAGRQVILDDPDNRQNVSIDPPDDGTQRIYHPIANGGLSTGAQGVDFFRGGDTVSNLTGVLHWSFAGQSGTDAWRIRPTQATPVAFTVANPRPQAAPEPTGLIKVASANVLNYFTSIDATANSSGTCGAALNLDCRGADSAAELVRQRERTTTALCGLGADLIGLVEIENTPNSNALTTLRDDLNASCGGANPWAIAGTDDTIGTDAIRVAQMYRTGKLNPVGSPRVDSDPIHDRPPMAQTYELVGGPQAGQRFSVVVNHLKSKGSCPGAGDPNADQADGQSCWALLRNQQAARTLAWVSGTVIPGAGGDPDVLLLGDFNAYGRETAIETIRKAGYIDVLDVFEPQGYTYTFDGQLGHLDYVFASASVGLQVMGAVSWPINADEVPLFDYNDDVRDTGESAIEEEPNGASRMPPRSLYEAASPFRASDHDPIVVGLFGLPPTISPIADQAGLVDTPLGGIAFTIDDPDGSANVVCNKNVTATSSNQVVVANAGIAISGTAQACVLTLTPVPGAVGTTTITVRVTDERGLSAEESFEASFLPELMFRDGFEPQQPPPN